MAAQPNDIISFLQASGLPRTELEAQLRASLELLAGEGKRTNGAGQLPDANLSTAQPATSAAQGFHQGALPNQDIRVVPIRKVDDPARGVYQKLGCVYALVGYIQKDKKNNFHGYTYASEAAIKKTMHEAFATVGLVLLPPEILEYHDGERQPHKDNNGQFLTTIKVRFTVADSDTGEKIEGTVYGRGQDNMDKGIYKALTGALKYWLTTAFLIPTGDDPEASDDAPDQPKNNPRGQRPRPAAERKAAEGIDTGGHELGTQAAADYVAQRKIENPRAGIATPQKPWKTAGEMKRTFAILREQLGEYSYLSELEKFGIRSADGFRKSEDAEECYKRLLALIPAGAA